MIDRVQALREYHHPHSERVVDAILALPDPVHEAARDVVSIWFAEHGGRTEQSEATSPAIERLRIALSEDER